MNGPCIDHGKTSVVGIGYASIYVNGTTHRLHRWIYCETNGVPIESIAGLVVMHSCDNPRCINPAHLSLGTQQDNMDDKMAKGRHTCPSGEDCFKAVLTVPQVKAIRSRYKPRCSTNGQRAMAREFGVSQMTIHDVIYNLTWKE
jgi:hypothetical protein